MRSVAPIGPAKLDAVPIDARDWLSSSLSVSRSWPTQDVALLAEGDQRLDESVQSAMPLEQRPVEPADLVVLAIRVVVAALRPTHLVAHGEHWRSDGEQEQREQSS